MNDIPPSLTDTIRDIQRIRSAIEHAEKARDGRHVSLHAVPTLILLHALAIVMVSILTYLDVSYTPSLTQMIIASYYVENLRFLGVIAILVHLAILVFVLYFLVWRSARRAGETLEEHIARNFRWLRETSFLSDLFVKYTAVALVILAQRPDWISGLLLILTGDYLIQGRFFVLPSRVAHLLGGLCMIFGTMSILLLDGYMWHALVPFLLITLLSTGVILKQNRQSIGTESEIE